MEQSLCPVPPGAPPLPPLRAEAAAPVSIASLAQEVAEKARQRRLSLASSATVPWFTLEGHSTQAKCVHCSGGAAVQLVFPLPNCETLYKWKCCVLRLRDASLPQNVIAERLLEKSVKVQCLGGFDEHGRIEVELRCNDHLVCEEWIMNGSP